MPQLAGAAAGAQRSLEEIVAQRLLAQRLQAEIAQQEQRSRLEQSTLNERIRMNDADLKRQERIDTEAADTKAASRRERDNAIGVRRMIGESITQGVTPESRKTLQGMAFGEGVDLPQELITDPTPKRHAVTVPGNGGLPIRKLVTEDELAEGVQEYREPKTPPKLERDPLADYEARLKLDAKYKQPGASDPVAEAKDTAREAKRIASSLLSHPGLSGAFGVIDARLPTMKQTTADAEVLRNALTSLLTLENMGKMKGVLSDSDMKVLRQASSTIDAPMSDQAARAELQRIVEVMGRAAGEGLPSMDLATSRGTTPAPAAAPSLYEQYLARKKGGR